MDPKWIKLIDSAVIEREGVRFMEKIKQRAEQSALEETLAFLKYVVEMDQ